MKENQKKELRGEGGRGRRVLRIFILQCNDDKLCLHKSLSSNHTHTLQSNLECVIRAADRLLIQRPLATRKNCLTLSHTHTNTNFLFLLSKTLCRVVIITLSDSLHLYFLGILPVFTRFPRLFCISTDLSCLVFLYLILSLPAKSVFR